MDSTRERWTRVLITAGLFLLATSLYLAWTLQREEGRYSIFDLLRGNAPPGPDPLAAITTAARPAVDLESVQLLNRLNEEYALLIESVLPSVVSIDVHRSVNVERRYYSPLGGAKSEVQEYLRRAGSGSGFIVSQEGHILTNHHVIEEGDEILVTLHGGNRYAAKVVGSDPRADVAVLKISGGASETFASLSLADSDRVRVGEMVIAVGSPFGFSESVTQGIISAKERRISDADTSYFQTDTVINPGSSGGPLLNLRGEVIGMAVSILAGEPGLNAWQGVGLAIPSNDVRAAFRAIVMDGRPSQGYLGISVEDIYPDTALQLGLNSSQGAVIVEVVRDSAAEHAGLRANDVVLTFNGAAVANTTELVERVRAERVGAIVQLGIVRDRERSEVEVRIGERSTAVALGASVAEGPPADSISDLLGIEVATLDVAEKIRLGFGAEVPAVIITGVRPGSPAAASLQEGDLVHLLNGQPVHSREEFIARINSVPLNRTSALLITHDGSRALFVFRPSRTAAGH